MNISEAITRVRELADELGGPIELIDVVRAMSWPTNPLDTVGPPSKATPRKRAPRKENPEAKAEVVVPERAAKAATAKTQRAPKPNGAKRQRASNAETEALKAKVWEHISSAEVSECSSGDIAKYIGEKRTDVARMLKKLVADGKVTVHGERRNARYSVVEA